MLRIYSASSFYKVHPVEFQHRFDSQHCPLHMGLLPLEAISSLVSVIFYVICNKIKCIDHGIMVSESALNMFK